MTHGHALLRIGVLAGALLAGCAASTTPSDGGGACGDACGPGRDCCGSACVNLENDPRNCGHCDNACTGDTFCTAGACMARPCTTPCGGGALCCGSECCTAGQLCCDPQGPLDMGPRCTDPTPEGTCPAGCAPLCVCASPDTPIATPSGDRAIADLLPGDLVYSVQGGALVVVPLAGVHRTPVSGDHRVVRVELETGRVLEISPGHPTADGRFFADLRAGDTLDGVRVVSAALEPYGHGFTYDVLPDSETATYVASGVLIGSTLAPADAPIALAAE